jgi:hypothetical protein
MLPTWVKCNAVCSGENAVKELDGLLDLVNFSNLLIPFSASMSQTQYNFYRAEAELPGVTSQFLRVLIGGLLRKAPKIVLPEGTPAEVDEWLASKIGSNNSSLVSFLQEVLIEELQTSRSWIYVDHPSESGKDVFPFPVVWRAQDVINWAADREGNLSRVIIRGFFEEFTEESPYHPVLTEVVYVHQLNKEGNYEILHYKHKVTNGAIVSEGKVQSQTNRKAPTFELIDTVTPQASDKPLTYIPAWPTNGSIDIVQPFLGTFVNKEVSLYNKLSRRNHLLYNSAAYTPWVSTTMNKESFEDAISAGLGSWIRLDQGDTIGVLATPTEALQDMEKAIASSIEDLAKLGVRMLAPENVQSGVALELRDSAQTSQLGLLNTQICTSLKAAIECMLFWKYNKLYEVSVELSVDFDPTPIGADWLRLATEWYQQGLLPRSVWLSLLRKNDLLPETYDDKEAIEEINSSELIPKQTKQEY